MSGPYIPNELLLGIAEHCDLKTLSNLTRASKVSGLVPRGVQWSPTARGRGEIVR